MSVRFNATDSNWLSRTTDVLDCNSAYTVMGWVRLASDQNDYGNFFFLGANNTGAQDIDELLGIGSTGTTLIIWVGIGGGVGTEVSGSTLTVGTWYHVALVRTSATNINAYLNGSSDITNTRDITGRAAAGRMGIGANNYSDSAFPNEVDGNVAAVKMWSTNLSEAEIQKEMWQFMPNRTLNLYSWTPFVDASTGTDFLDYSGNARPWTEVGSVTFEDNPPIQWRRGRSRIFIPTAAVTTRRWLFGAH